MNEHEVSDRDRYSQYWTYLRHIETLRFHLATVVVAVATPTLGVVLGVDGLSTWGRVVALTFLTTFVWAALMHLVAHKRMYRRYYHLMDNLDADLPEPQEGSGDTFIWLLGMLSVMYGAVLFGFLDVLSWWGSIFVVIGLVALIWSWWAYKWWPLEASDANRGTGSSPLRRG